MKLYQLKTNCGEQGAWLSGNFRGDSHIWWSPGKETVTFKIEENALEDMGQIEQAIATSFQDFDLVIKTFDKTTVGSLEEEISDFLPPMDQGFQEIVKAS